MTTMEYSQIDLYEFLTESELQHYYNAIKNELKITNAAQFKYATDEDLKSIGLSRPEIRRLRKFYEKYFPHGYLSKIKRLLQAPTTIVKRDEASGSFTPTPTTPEPNTGTKANSSPSKAPNNKHIIPADSISVNKQLGTGEFGIVQQGVWTNGNERIQVAIKCLCRERMQSNPMEFLKEAAIMHSIEHENIVRLYGVVLSTESMMLVTELAHLRSLLECLKDSGLRVSFLTVPTLCEFAMQICNGMRYLENKRLIHRDLAARNILVFSKNKVKISDFGLSRALGVGKDYYKTNFNVNLKLPIAWCAPECINYLKFTNASDVWAFGVCLWEMFSYGFQPWAALTGLQILEAIDAPNYQRLEQPECCPTEYYTLMMKCWQDDPAKRPKFNEIYEMLPDMKPEQLKAVVNHCESKKDHLVYRQGEIITVLDRNTGTAYWKGVLNSGKTGYFNPSNTVAFLEGLPSSNRDSFCRVSDQRSSKRKLRTEMISKPQNDFKHTGHVGIDGASFGDIAFLSTSQSYNHVPRQIVTPYKPSEDIEQTPLLLPQTPTSPDSLQTASGYFAEGATSMNPSFIPSTETTPKHLNQPGQSSFEFPHHHSQAQPQTTSTNPFTQDGQFSFALQNNNYSNDKGISEEPHEYHEISDDEITPDKLDFGPSLLDEINSMFGSMGEASTTNAPTHHVHSPKSPDFDHINIKNEFTEMTSKLVNKNDTNGNSKFGTSSKKKSSSGQVKPISVKDEKILNQFIEMTNEISARSMIDLVSDQSHSMATHSPKRKFSFRFPHLTSSTNGSSEKSHSSSSNNPTGNSSHGNQSSYGLNSPFSKKKNFTEELKSIPDLQRFRSLNEMKNDIRLPLFDKESSDFCFEKSREILSRPLALDPPENLKKDESFNSLPYRQLNSSGGSLGGGVSRTHSNDSGGHADHLDTKSLNENIMDIENTLKALNLDFMHTYTEFDKTDSDETILNEKFSSLVNSLDEEISSAKSAVYSYNNGVQTMFDFNAATSHLDKHLQYMSAQQAAATAAQQGALNTPPPGFSDVVNEQKMLEDKRSSTPDTGFASRDTNLSLSRRSSQKSSYSPQDTFFSGKDLMFGTGPGAGGAGGGGDRADRNVGVGNYPGLRDESFSYERFSNKRSMASPIKSALNASNTSVYSNNQLKLDGIEHFKSKTYRQRSMSFTDNVNPVSPVLSEPQQRLKRQTRLDNSQGGVLLHRNMSEIQRIRRSGSYKPRSIRARTLRRLSYNSTTLLASSSSSEDESDYQRHLARSECDIRSRSASLYRRRRQGLNRKVMSACTDEPEIITIERNSKIYGSNASIKSAPHYNYGNNSSALRHYHKPNYDQPNSFHYDDRIYDFGGGKGPGNNYKPSATPIQSKTFQKAFQGNGYNLQASGGSLGNNSGGSGSSSAASSVPLYNNALGRSAGVYQEFDVSRLTGKSPTSNFISAGAGGNSSSPDALITASPPKSLPSLPQQNTLHSTANNCQQQQQQHHHQQQHHQHHHQNIKSMEFQWPEKIHASTVKQNEMLWRQQKSYARKTSSYDNPSNPNLNPNQKPSPFHSNIIVGHYTSSDTSSSESEDNNDRHNPKLKAFTFRQEFVPPHVPPSPAP